MLHPYLKILLLLVLAVQVQFMTTITLAASGMLLMGAAFACCREHLNKMLRRTRWLLLTLLLVYAFTTPGEYLRGWPFALAPTYEGIVSGAMQAVRLVIMLAGLALLLGSTGRESLMSGIYCLLWPLRLFGFSPARFTARLWLTLHYFEQAPIRARGAIWSELDKVEAADDAPAIERLTLEMPGYAWLDVLLLLVGCVGLIWWLI